jgi:hypothetical protein
MVSIFASCNNLLPGIKNTNDNLERNDFAKNKYSIIHFEVTIGAAIPMMKFASFLWRERPISWTIPMQNMIRVNRGRSIGMLALARLNIFAVYSTLAPRKKNGMFHLNAIGRTHDFLTFQGAKCQCQSPIVTMKTIKPV